MRTMEVNLYTLEELEDKQRTEAMKLFNDINMDNVQFYIQDLEEVVTDLYSWADWDNIRYSYDLCSCDYVYYKGKLDFDSVIAYIKDNELLEYKVIKRLEFLSSEGVTLEADSSYKSYNRVYTEFTNYYMDYSGNELLVSALDELEKISLDLLSELENKVTMWIDSELEYINSVDYITDYMSNNDCYISIFNGKMDLIYNPMVA